jgi:ABC-type lipoprotein export system ATPase subunit
MASELVRLSDYTLEALVNGNDLKNFNLVLSKGDAFSIVTDSSDDAHHLLRGVAGLDAPKSGRFLYKGEEIDFSDYRNLLHYKRNVGYVASDAIFLANRSIHDNLMLMRHYFEDSTCIEMCTEAVELCRVFDLEKRLDLKPHQLDPEEHRLFVIVRELSKNPEILLIEKPGDFLARKSFEALKGILRNLIKMDLALMFFSTDQTFTDEFANRRIAIDKGTVTSFVDSGKGL